MPRPGNSCPRAISALQFAVSETTIRRDFQEMAKAGLIQRQHGGAQLSKTPTAAKRGHGRRLAGFSHRQVP